MGGENVLNYTQHTAKEIMKKNGLGDLLIGEFITAITRYTYEQDSSMNGLTGETKILQKHFDWNQ